MARLNAVATILLVASVAAFRTAQATTTDFTDPTAFAAATTNLTTIGFNGILPPGVAFEDFNRLTLAGVSFSTPTPGTFVNVTTANYYSPYNYPADFIVDSVNPSPNNVLVISLPQPTHALALDYGGLGFTGVGTATITLSNGHVFIQAGLPPVGNTAFVGFVSTDPITTLTLVTTNDNWVVKDFVLATPASTGLVITSLSSTSPTPMTPLLIGTTGIATNSPVTIQFSNTSGFSVTEHPTRIAPDGTVIVGVPIYVDPSSGQIAPGTVSAVLTQGNQSTSPVTLNIQDLPPLSAYGTQLGEITETFLNFEAMEIARRINEFQAYQALPGNTVDTSQAQATLQTLLTGIIEMRSDIDHVLIDNTVEISAGMLPDGTPIQFDQTSLDIMDRMIGVYLTEIAPIILPPSSSKTQSPSTRLSPANPSTIHNVINVLKLSANLSGLTQTFQGYQEAKKNGNTPTLIDYLLVGGGAANGVFGVADTAGHSIIPQRTNAALGAFLASLSLLQHLGNELGDLGFIMVASHNGGDPTVIAEAQKDLNDNAKLVATDTITAELSLLEYGADPKAPSFGPDVVHFLKGNIGQIELQSAYFITNLDAIGITAAITAENYDLVLNTALNAAAETVNLFPSSAQGFAEITGRVNVPSDQGIAAPLPGVQLSSDLTDVFSSIADLRACL